MRTALITGVTGQDSFHLAGLLLLQGYRVVGITSGREPQRLQQFSKIFPSVHIIKGDFGSPILIKEIISDWDPTEIYNLAAISSVALSFQEPELTKQVNYNSVVSLLKAVYSCETNSSIKFYHSSSSEMFGDTRGEPISELSQLDPQSPYGEAKAKAFEYCRDLASNSKLFISQGILFNHESEFRQKGFVSQKIIDGLIRIKNGQLKKIELGDLSPKRDWGYAADYVEAIYRIVQQEEASEFVIASGQSNSIEQFVLNSIQALGLEGNLSDYVDSNVVPKRPSEIYSSVGNPSKAYDLLGWRARYSFQELVEILILKNLHLLDTRSQIPSSEY